jgi:hypothetical protein
MTFTIKLERADGTPAAVDRQHSHELAARRHDPAERRALAASDPYQG